MIRQLKRPIPRLIATLGLAVAAVTAAVVAPTPAFSAGGVPALDSTFSGDGIVTPNLGGPDGMYGVAVQPDGKVVVVGQFMKQRIYRPVVLRYLDDGTPDSTFGANGRVNLPFAAASVSEVVLQPDGKIVAAGFASGRLLIVRLTTDGALDASFSGNGWLRGPVTWGRGSNDWPPSLALDSVGRLVLAINRFRKPDLYDASLLRYLPGGRLDTTFSGDGILPLNGPGQGAAIGVAVDAGDRVLTTLGGWRQSAPRVPTTVVRVTKNGRFDATFSGDGRQQIRINGSKYGTWPLSVSVNATGSIAVGLTEASGPGIGVVQLLPSGAPDPAFGTKGKVVARCKATCWVSGLMTDAGYVIYGGKYTARAKNTTALYLARFLPDGSGLDPSFGQNGKWVRDLFNGWEDAVGGAATDSSGRLLLTGVHQSPTQQDGWVGRLTMN